MLFGAQHLLDWMDIFSVGKKRYRKQILLNLDKGKGIMVFWRLTGTNSYCRITFHTVDD